MAEEHFFLHSAIIRQPISTPLRLVAMSQVTLVRQEDPAVHHVTSQEKEMTKRKQQEMKPQQVEIKSQQEMTTTKRVRIELDNVQNIVESIRTDFNYYQHLNNELRLQLLKKKTNRENLEANTNDLSTHLGCLGAKVSVNQKKYQQQVVELDYFEKSLDELVSKTISGFHSKVEEVFELLNEMFSENQQMEVYQDNLRHSLKNIESRRDAVLSSFNNLTEQKSNIEELNAEYCLDLQALHVSVTTRESENVDKEKELGVLIHESTLIHEELVQVEHQLDVDQQQVDDQEASLLTLQTESRVSINELHASLSALREKIRTLQEEEVCNKQGHLKRLKDDIATKMEDTHTLNRECDKATMNFAEQEHQLQDVRDLLKSTAQQAKVEKEAKQRAAEQVRDAEQALEAAKQQALDSEKLLAERIESSKASISAFFSLKKEANAKEWELRKAKVSLEQRINRQAELLSGLESHNLVTKLKLESEAQEQKERITAQLKDLSVRILTLESEVTDNQALLSNLREKEGQLAQQRETLLEEQEELQQRAARQRAAAEAQTEAEAEEAKEKEALQEEMARISELKDSLDQQLLNENQKAAVQLQEEADETAAVDERQLTTQEVANIEAAVELMFQEWLESEEGRDQQQRHADRLQELRNQTQQLQAELEEGGGDRGGLFPQVVIDRNNELARLKQNIAATWESLKKDSFSNFVSTIEKSIEHKSRQEAQSVSTSATVLSLSPIPVSSAHVPDPLTSSPQYTPKYVDAEDEKKEEEYSKDVPRRGESEDEFHSKGGQGGRAKTGDGRGRKNASRISALTSALLGEKTSSSRSMPPPRDDLSAEQVQKKDRGKYKISPQSREGGGLFFPSQGANLRPLVPNAAPLPLSSSSRLHSLAKKDKGKQQNHNLCEMNITGCDGSLDAAEAESEPAHRPKSVPKWQKLKTKAITNDTSTARMKAKLSGGDSSGISSANDRRGVLRGGGGGAIPSPEDTDWFFSENW